MCLAGRFSGQSQILEHQFCTKPTGITPGRRRRLDNPWPWVVGVRTPAAPGGAVDDSRQHLGVDAQRIAQGHGFADADHGDTQQQVVADLGDLPGAYFATSSIAAK